MQTNRYLLFNYLFVFVVEVENDIWTLKNVGSLLN